MLQSQASPIQPVDTVVEEEPTDDPNNGKVFGAEQQLGGKESRLSASHVIVRSKLHFDGDGRPMSKSTSRIAEVTGDVIALSKENEDTFPIPEDPLVATHSEGMVKPQKIKLSTIFLASLVHSESKSDEAPITVGEVSQLCRIIDSILYVHLHSV